jgi:rubrerythrin
VNATVSRSELERRHGAAAKRFAEEQWNLGGLAYEMAIRDHFRLDVLQRAAAKVQEADAELSNLKRLLELEQQGAAGSCAECGTLHARGASFCSSCGAPLVESLQLG